MRWACLLLVGCEFVHGGRDDASPSDSPVPADASLVDGARRDLVAVIGASEDDALQDPGGGTLVAYSWVSLYSGDHWGALRFQIADIERGATIHDAYLALVIDSVSEDSPNVVFATEASSTPAALAALLSNISNRPRGTARVTWNAANVGQGLQSTPSLRDLVQERVADPTWSPGARILFVVDGQTGSSFEFRQYDHTLGAHAARLHVSFTNP